MNGFESVNTTVYDMGGGPFVLLVVRRWFYRQTRNIGGKPLAGLVEFSGLQPEVLGHVHLGAT